ncbi:MAG: Spy/CpxP family protein refolding chaperone [Betaproteobacteria bacterium]|nr:Spy/CpxP family protein refolding chaperone [Betaproteobacteria bacterium]
MPPSDAYLITHWRCTMKKIYAVAVGMVAGAALAVAAVTYAQPFGGMGPGAGSGTGMGPGLAHGMGPGHGPMAHVDPSTMAESRLADLKAQLKITAEQDTAWQAFADAAKQQATGMQAMRAQMQAGSGTAPERMAQRASAMRSVAYASRQAEVSKRGAEVMPFELNATTHIFTKTDDGGVQEVVAKNPKDSEQIRLIRAHLRQIARELRKGDFSAPTQIHGMSMPGLAELKRAKSGEVDIRYRDVDNGGELRYSTHNASLVAALHQWFDAQLADHGADAMAGHMHDHMMGRD